MGFPRQEYWSGLPLPSPSIFPTRDRTHISCITNGFFTTEPPGKPKKECVCVCVCVCESESLWCTAEINTTSWTNYISIKKIPPSYVIILWGRGFWKWLDHKGRALRKWSSVLIRRDMKVGFLLSSLWGHSEKLAVHESGSGFSPDTVSAGTLTLDCPASASVRNKFLLFLSHLVYGALC